MAHAGLLTKGVELSYATSSTASFTKLDNLQSFPDLGGSEENVDVTTLDDSVRVYIPGIKDFGSLDFGFLYDGQSGSYGTLASMSASTYWKVKLPDSHEITFTGVPSISAVGAGVNDALQFTLSIRLDSDITL